MPNELGADRGYSLSFSTVDGDVLGAVVPGDVALERWRRARDEAEENGRWPLLLGPAVIAESVLHQAQDPDRRSPAAILAEADRLDVRALFARWAEDTVDPDDEDDDVVGEWPDEPPGEDAAEADGLLGGVSDDEVLIILMPTPSGWQAPAWLNWGGWNACPRPEEHVAVLKHWHATHGAELVSMTTDQAMFRVARPPATRAGALAIAEDHFAYCPDIVLQGVGTISNLAAMLIDGPTWTFWWD